MATVIGMILLRSSQKATFVMWRYKNQRIHVHKRMHNIKK
jgi:hypothetical protein